LCLFSLVAMRVLAIIIISVMATIMDVLRAALRDNAFEAISIQLVSVLSMP